MQALLISLITWLIAGAEAWFAYPIINTPLVLCPIVGAICGDLGAGIVAGATLQLIFLGVMAIGGTLPADAALGSIVGTFLAIQTGQSVEVAVTFAVPVALIGSSLTFVGYFIRTLFVPVTQKLVDSGNDRGLEIEHICLAWLPELPKYILCFAVLAFGTGLAENMINAMPQALLDAMDFATGLLPAVGIALLLKVMWNKSTAVYFFAGLLLALYFGQGTLSVALIGVVVAVIAVFGDGRRPETQQALGYTYAMLPVLRRFYPDKEKRIEAMKRHHVLFNTTPTMGGIITGLSASMEKEASENPEFDTSSINTVKVALMGPFAGIGDSIFQGTLRVITLGIGISLAATGNIFGAILHILLYNVLAHLVRYYGVTKSYEMGGQLMSNMSESGLMSKLTKAASIVGMMTVGAMAVTMTNFTIDRVWTIQGSEIVVQSVLDSIFPQLLPLLLTFGCYKAVKKGMSPALLMLILIVAGTLGKFLGLL